MTSTDYSTTYNIQHTIDTLKEQYGIDTNRTTQSADKREEILNNLYHTHTNHTESIQRIAAHELLLQLTGNPMTAGM